MKKSILSGCAAALLSCAGFSLDTAAAEPAQPATTSEVQTTPVKEEAEPLFYRPWTVGVEGGTTGFGALGSWRFADHLGVRAGVDYVEFTRNDDQIRGIHYHDTLRLLSEPITLDVYPWKLNSFHVSLGLMLNQNQLTGSAIYDNTIVLDGQTFSRSSVGSLDLKIKQQPVNPYLSVGGNFFYFDRPHQWALGGELGVAYTGNPDVSLTRTGPASTAVDSAVARTQTGLQKYADDYKWWPILKIFVTYSF